MTCHRYHWELESSHDPDHHNHSDVYIVENILKLCGENFIKRRKLWTFVINIIWNQNILINIILQACIAWGDNYPKM